jgi:predicted nucleotidyltransferase
MKFGLPESVVLKIQHVFSQHPEIEKVMLYGSRAKGNFRPGSDIDLTILGSNADPQLLSLILTELDDLNTPYLMDVSLFSQITSVELRAHIDNFGQIFYLRPRVA